jgi:hypothetical protein
MCGCDALPCAVFLGRYLAMVERARINECASLTAAILRGLSTQVPVHVLSLFTWEELELMVCGNPTVDIELLKASCRADPLLACRQGLCLS